MLILDSNTISHYFRGDPHVVPRLQALRPADLGVPAIVEYELRYGLMRLPEAAATPRLAALTQLLRPMQLLPFDSECAAAAARIRAQLETAGQPIGPHDTLIAPPRYATKPPW
jgi:tRNA(fMet)-specific endonuclease VapC